MISCTHGRPHIHPSAPEAQVRLEAELLLGLEDEATEMSDADWGALRRHAAGDWQALLGAD